MRISAGLTAIAVLGACTSAPQPPAPATQDISFARGCWIERKPSGETQTMRVLPARDDSGAMQLDLMIYGATPDAGRVEGVGYTISPNGATIAADIRSTGAPVMAVARAARDDLEPGWTSANWRAADGSLIIALKGNGDDRLIFRQTRVGGNEMVVAEFNGQRDGCD